jgi:hypothetical protein
MGSLLRLALVMPALLLGACAHTTSDTNQFYRAQTYLPLADPPPGNSPLPPADCVAGPVLHAPRNDDLRKATKPLPGMTLQVYETSYSPTRDDATPSASEWRWTIPALQKPKPCAQGTAIVPIWSRSDMLRVRHLLSRAQHPQKQDAGTTYFAEAFEKACPEKNLPDCFEDGFLDRFVAGLVVNLRAQFDKSNVPGDGSEFDPAPPVEVLASASVAEIKPDTGLAKWYSELTHFRGADLFTARKRAEECSRAFANGKDPATQDAEVCQFALASLEWRKVAGVAPLPGTTLSKFQKLWLLRSGDPAFLMQPTAYRAPLDASNADPCGGDKTCPLARRMSQGFVHFNLLIPVSLDGGRTELVDVGSSISDFEGKTGLTVVQVSRSVDWLPAKISVEKGKTVEARELADSTGRVALRFAESKSGARHVTISPSDSVKKDLLFAPGDVVSVADVR